MNFPGATPDPSMPWYGHILYGLGTALIVGLFGLYRDARNRRWMAEDNRRAVKPLERKMDDNTDITRQTQATTVAALREANHVNLKFLALAGRPMPDAQGTVLLVEDHEASAVALDKLLTVAGWTVIRAGGVREAVLRLSAFAPDAVVFDVMLPDGSGADVIGVLRDRESKARIVVATGCDDERLALIRALKPDAILHKPLGRDELLAALKPAAVPALAVPAIPPLPLPTPPSQS